jgi:hypothetical protein
MEHKISINIQIKSKLRKYPVRKKIDSAMNIAYTLIYYMYEKTFCYQRVEAASRRFRLIQE